MTLDQKLLLYAQQFEDQHAPENITTTLREAAAEIERLRARLEIDPSHPYDGIYARDETIRQQDKQVEHLRARVTELEGQHKGLVLNNAILRERPDLPLNRIPAARAMTKLYEDNERLRAALERIRDVKPSWGAESEEMYEIARAALEGK